MATTTHICTSNDASDVSLSKMSDYRKKFFVNVSGTHLGFDISEGSWDKDVQGLSILQDYLDNENFITLYVTLSNSNDKKQIHFQKDMLAPTNLDSRIVVFYKNNPTVLNDDNLLTALHITSLQGPPTTALYHTLNHVFSPLIIKNERRSVNQNNIERQLVNLQTGLRTTILTGNSDLNPLKSVDPNSLTVVLSLEHEVEFWNNVAHTSKSVDLRTTSAALRDILQPLSRDFTVLEALPLTDVEDVLENAHNILDDLWRHEPPYPKTRMEHLMDIIASDVCHCILKQASKCNFWGDEYNTVRDLLEQCIATGGRWVTSCKQLTEIFWPNYSLHAWTGDPYVPYNLVELLARLDEVLNARTIHKQLVRLLTINEQNDLNTEDMFKPFQEIQILKYGNQSEQQWKTAKKQFEYLLQPVEQCVAFKLKKQLSSVDANTRQLLHEFGRYSELISRPILKQTLQNERQYLLTALKEYTKQLASPTSETTISKYDTPQVVDEILITRQAEAKATEVQKVAQKLLDDLRDYEDLNHSLSNLIANLKRQHNEMFESWTSEISAQIKNESLSLKETDPVVRFSKDKLMRVNYSPRFVSLISEVRQLSAMGYRIPSRIEDVGAHAKKFMKYASILEQIANFHNTIGDRMIPSQRPMMLASALNLSRLVQEEEVVSWGDITSVERYIENLKSAVENLSKENNLLTTYHVQVIEKIKTLEDVDLIKYYQKWKDSTKSMRDIMAQVQQKGFKSMQSWKVDVDRNLCKVLEIQYMKSLDTVHLYLPEIYADLIYRDSYLQFSPDEVVLKEKYEQQLKRFLEIPRSFRGVSDNAEANIFAEIMDRCKAKLSEVDKNTDGLFVQLKGVAKHWESWLTLESLDTSKLTSWEHWDLHFRASKTFGQEIAKLPSTEERVGCFIVGLSRLRSDLESHNRSYWDRLIVSLKDSIVNDVVRLQQYVDTSTATLNRQPLTLEQIGEADESHAIILKERPEMEKLYKEMIRKAQMLASWTREQIDSVNRLEAAWNRLQSLLENHEHIIAKQMHTIKTTLSIATENLNNEIERFAAKWDQVKPRPNSGQIANDTLPELHNYLTNIRQKREQWKALMEQKEKIINDNTKFGMDPAEFPLCFDIEEDLGKQEDTWSLFEEFYSDLEKIRVEEWIVFRKKSYRLEEFLSDWQDRLQKLENSALITRMLKEIHKYQAAVPSLKYVRGEDFTEKHWMEVCNLLGMVPKPIDVLCLRDFLDVSDALVNNAKELQIICKKAASEIIVRQALAELDQWEVESHFVLLDHLDSHNKTIMLIKDFKDILNKIGDNQSLLQSVKNSSDYDSFSQRAALWENKLSDLDQHLTALAQIQRKWVYLEPIFGGGTLVQERTRFERLDRDFRQLFQFIQKDARVCALCRYASLRAVLENLHDQLARCQKSLDEFLADKRNNFSRFLFLGDDDLLEIVGQSSKEHVIQSHLKKLFAGIHSIKLDDAQKKIVAICSLEGEIVGLSNSIDINQPVEIWLNALVKEMQTSLRDLLSACLKDGANVDPLKYPSQILCLADSVTFTTKCEQAINGMTLPPLLATYKTQLNHYSSLELNDNKSPSYVSCGKNDEGSNILELKLKALLLDTIHHINVIEELIDDNVTKVADWTWQKQLRFYRNNSAEVTIKMVNAKMEYAYEYLGNAPKLVRTPLTDQCFLTLTQGAHLGMGGNPYGPAGTGKTETVKALGCLLGRQVLVFNCDEGIDTSSMGRILSGLVRTGAWGCFDEFNRLDEATLSAISMQIQPIQNALKDHKDTVTLLDQQVQVNKHCGIFVTLNPAGGNYGGRNRLPDNLKQLFRPVVMTHPDHEQIARTLLHCDGYQNANVIGRKLVEIFSLSSKLLSKQQHYDWGLRALKTVLSGCSRALKQVKRNNSTINEYGLVAQALRMDTVSKLTFVDSVKFQGLLNCVFPEITTATTGHESLVVALEESCKELGLVVNKRQINKCVEFYEQLKQRMGVAIIGPPSSGKSSVRNILFHALNKMGRLLKQKVFNPKSLARTQLLGQIDLDTRQWTDGVLTLYSLQVTAESLDVWSWIVCDGDVDPEWVESLNSVLDDNKLLSLPSGWRIQFGPNVNFVFETHELSHASPATVSRMGVVFLSEEDLDVNDFVAKFLNDHPDASDVLRHYINDYYQKAIDWVLSEGEMVIPSSTIGITKTALSQLINVTNKAQFTVQMINGLGGQLEQSSKENFAQQMFEWTKEPQPALPARAHFNRSRDIIESYYTNANQTIDAIENGLPLILTAQICQAMDCLRLWLKAGNEQHFVLVGPHGSAKSLLLENLIKERSDADLAIVHCSAHITPKYVIHKFAQYCIVVSSSKGRMYKPKKGHLFMYFKNIHLLKCDQWGTNLVIQFLQQLIALRGFFDNALEWVGIENVTIVGSLIVTNKLSVRFSSLVHIYSTDSPEKEELMVICNAHITAVLKKILPANHVWTNVKISKLTSTMITIYNEVKETFTLIEHQHYVFSPHEISKWCDGILRYKNTNDDDVEQFVLEVISYEALKLFGEKLVSEADREKLHKIINDALINDWGKSALPKTTPNHFYVPITNTHSSRTTATLAKLNVDDWSNIVKKSITQYEREGQQLDIIITPEILHLTASIGKILTASRGSALMVGSCGVGRKSSVRIMSAFQSAKLVVPATSNQPQFNNDLKFAMQQSGIEDEHVYLLLEDHLLRHENILNIVNTLLSSAEVPGLYNTAEFDSLIAGLKDEAGRENFEGNLPDFFVKRVQKKLHVVVCLDKDNEIFFNILENCPALYQKCSVVWLSGWTGSTMENIPKMIIDQINGNGNSNEPIEVSDYFYKIHATIKSRIATPLRYVQLIKTYSKIYLEKKTTTINRKNKLQMGVSKLTEARNVVADLKLKAAEQQEKLTEKQEKANLALDMISTTMRNANTHKQEMEVLKQHTEKENELLIKRKKEIELELAEVEPLIQEARAAVGNIKAESLSEIRSLRAPPDIIRDILEGVLRLMGIQDTSWNSMKTFLAKRGVKEDIRSFDASKINPDSRVAVERLMHNKGDSFDPKASKRASVAAAPLASWVTANVRYSHVLDKIKPLSREQNRLKQNLESAKLQLGELSTGLTDVDATVAKLKDQLSTYTKEAAEIEIHLTRAQETLKAAEGLVGKLNDEYERWQSQLEELSLELQELSINCLLSGAFITYLSSEPEDIRTRIGSDWMEIIRSQDSINFTLEEFLSSEREQLQWQSEGISSDQLSIQNAIIILNSNLHSLIVDPTNVASEWIRAHFRHKTVETVAQNSPKFNTTLELAIRFGKILIIEEVDSVSPVLLPVLRQEFILQGERKMIKFHGKLIDYNNDFQLLLTSRNTQLKLTPDLTSVVNLVNFTITRAGLTEQLLISSIRQESPELEERRKQLLREREELQEKQYVLQNQLLEDLATSSGDILLNKNLLASLNETKASSNSIASALTESKIVQSKLQQEYDIYKEISSFGSSLYFAALEFSKINILYLLSVSSYVKLFLKSLTSLQGVQNTFGFLQRILIQSLYQYMGRGIFKAERLTFILHLLHKIYPTQISEHEWKFFLGYAVETKIEKSDDLPPWLPTHAVQQMSSLQSALPRLYNSLNLSEQSAWKHFMDSSDCEINFPSHCKLSEFQKVLIIQALRPDRLYSTLILFVVHITGLKSINLDVLQLSQILQESEHSEPILLLTTSGTDPSVEIRDLAQLKVGLANYTEIAMGAGQETKAITTLHEASRLGHWLTLKNLHLVSSWLPELCQNLQNINGHPNFRLWLVTETHSLFSPVLSQNCLKISYEAPQGIKSNLQRTYATWGPDYIKKLHPTAARIFFVLSCIHALLQERRTYVPQGWTKWYEFSDVDLSTAVKLLEEIWMNQNAQVPWKYFRGLCADAVYGGRIENIEDYSILDAYVRQYFDDSVLSHRWRPFQLNSPISMSTNYQDYINAILQISNRDLPSYFGLPENIDRSWEKNISDGIIAKLKDLYRAKSFSIKFDRQIWHRGLMPYMTLWKKLNHGQDYLKININTQVNENENPIIDFIFEEFCNAIRLIQKIHKYFTILNKNIRGSLTPEKEIVEIAGSLLNQQTPMLWLKIWPGPLDPNKYLKTIITKAGNISKWRNEPVDYFFTTPMNLSLLFNPETLLAAFKLHVSRKHNVAIDELVLQTSWKMKQDTITLTGLLMEGALFDGYILSTCTQSSETINSIPNCCLSWSREKIAVISEKIIDVPLFYASNREKQVTSLQVPCNAKEKDKWIQAGLAIFISY